MAVGSKIEWTDTTWNPVTWLQQGQPRLQVMLCRAAV